MRTLIYKMLQILSEASEQTNLRVEMLQISWQQLRNNTASFLILQVRLMFSFILKALLVTMPSYNVGEGCA